MSDRARPREVPGPVDVGVLASTEHRRRATPRLDAERLVAHTLGVERIELYIDLDRVLSAEELDAARALVARRGARRAAPVRPRRVGLPAADARASTGAR